jgi:uncharacterized protein (DUF2141 family)
MKSIIFIFLMLCFAASLFAGSKTRITIANVASDGGAVYVAVFNSAGTYKNKKPLLRKILKERGSILSFDTELPDGEYVVSAYQDLNGNGRMDRTLGIPKEPVGISNYDGKGFPGGFEKHKVSIGPSSRTIQVELHRVGR